MPSVGTKADVVVQYPLTVQLSSPPLGGKYKVKCVTSTGIVSYTKAIAYSTRVDRIANYIGT